jgi:hypothetical protein
METFYIEHRVANASSESLNAKIHWAKYTPHRILQSKNFMNAIYFHCGGLDWPQTPLQTRKSHIARSEQGAIALSAPDQKTAFLDAR